MSVGILESREVEEAAVCSHLLQWTASNVSSLLRPNKECFLSRTTGAKAETHAIDTSLLRGFRITALKFLSCGGVQQVWTKS